METKIGVYLCSGCGIGGALDLEDLGKEATSAGASLCKTHECLCAPEAVAMVQNDIAAESLNRLVLGACSGRAMMEAFQFTGEDLFVERCSLREQVAWVRPPQAEDTQMLGQDYVRMAVAKCKNAAPPEATPTEASKVLLVVKKNWRSYEPRDTQIGCALYDF